MAANYNRPKPIDPIWHREAYYLRIRCTCGRRMSERLGVFALRHKIPQGTQLYQLIDRLRCRMCDARPLADVGERP